MRSCELLIQRSTMIASGQARKRWCLHDRLRIVPKRFKGVSLILIYARGCLFLKLVDESSINCLSAPNENRSRLYVIEIR